MNAKNYFGCEDDKKQTIVKIEGYEDAEVFNKVHSALVDELGYEFNKQIGGWVKDV